MSQLFEYQDINDEVDLPDCSFNSSCVIYQLNKIKWNPLTIVNNVVTFTSNVNSGQFSVLENGSLSISVSIIQP
jgi:hypothetical protein